MSAPFIVGVTFKDTDLDKREALTLPLAEMPQHLENFVSDSALAECIILCTCNRIEFYAVPADDVDVDEATQAVRRLWAECRGLTKDAVADEGRLWTGEDAVRHTLSVMASLDSLVVGEAQILGQVKDAYRTAQAAGSVGPILRALFEHGLKTAKKVRTETAIGAQSVSISSVAVDLAKQIFDPMKEVRVLLVGAGKMAALAGKSLADAGAQSITVVNRTQARAERLAGSMGWRARSFEDLDLLLPEVEVVITSTGAAGVLITAEMVEKAMKKRRYKPLFFIDIAVPRDVDSAVSKVDRAYLYNIDDLEQLANQNLEARQNDVEAAMKIIEAGVVGHDRKESVREKAPLLGRVAAHADAIRDQELNRAISRLEVDDEKSRQILFQMAHNISRRLTRGAFKVIKNGDEGQNDLDSLLGEIYELPEAGLDAESSEAPSEEEGT
jgi:glutamyl-tRNA reductase